MEDTHVNMDDVNAPFGFADDKTRAFYGVFDGHGGVHAADLAQTFFHNALFRSDRLKAEDVSDADVVQVLREAFFRTDSIIVSRSRSEGWTDGCTAAVVFILGNRFV